MALQSIVQFSKLQNSQRLDAQFYTPELLHIRKLLNNSPELHSKAKRITDFGAYSQMNFVEYKNIGVKFLRNQDVGEVIISNTNSIFIDETTYEKLSLKLEEGDVVLPRVGTLGKSAVITEDILPCSANQNLAQIQTKVGLSPYYLSVFLSTEFGLLQVFALATGNVQPWLNLQQIGQIRIFIPSPKFQDVIDKLSISAVNKEKISVHANIQAEQLLLSELGLMNWKPVPALTYVKNYSQASKARRIDAEHFQPKYAELRESIRGYSNGYLKITDIATNSDETTEPHTHPENDYRYVELANINQVIGTIESTNEIKGKEAPSRARMLLRAGDVIASTVEGSLDKVALVSEEYHEAIGSTGFFVLRPRNVQSGYLLALVKSIIVREQMRCESSGTILAAVSAKSLRNVIVPNIPSEKRGEIAKLVEQAHMARREAKIFLEKAKHAVEIAIEENEERALEFIG